MLISEGDSYEQFNILIKSEPPPSGFWQLHKATQFSGLLMNESNWDYKSEWGKCLNIIKSLNEVLIFGSVYCIWHCCLKNLYNFGTGTCVCILQMIHLSAGDRKHQDMADN